MYSVVYEICRNKIGEWMTKQVISTFLGCSDIDTYIRYVV